MRLLWLQHVYWTRMLIVSIVGHMPDEPEVTARLLRNPKDIAGVFAHFYGPEAAAKIEALLTEHLQIAAELVTAARDGLPAAALRDQWYENADEMARAFAAVNPCYDEEKLRAMLRRHLDLTTQEAQAQLRGEYAASIEIFGEVEKEALRMADDFSCGIIRQCQRCFAC